MRPVTVEQARALRAAIAVTVAHALARSEPWYDLYRELVASRHAWRQTKALRYRTKAVVTFDRELT